MYPRKYHVTLMEEEHKQLLDLVKVEKNQAYRITHAQVLLKLDETFNDRVWTTKEIAIACSDAPEGRERWTLQMIADRLVELKVVDSISATAVGTELKKRIKTLAP